MAHSQEAIGQWLLGTPAATKGGVQDFASHLFWLFWQRWSHMQHPPPVYDLLQRNADINLSPRKFNAWQVGDSGPHFALFPAIPKEPTIVIVVDRAATVVEVLRRLWDADDSMILARELLRRCIPFHTCICGPFRANTFPQNPRQPPATLG